MNGGTGDYDFAFQLEELGQFDQGHRWASFRGIGQRPGRPLHDYWAAVAIRAVHTMTKDDDPEDWYDLSTQVYVKHESPGWIDGFRVKAG